MNLYSKNVGTENFVACLKKSKNRLPIYLFYLVHSSSYRYLTRNSDNISQIRKKLNFFKNCFFPSTINEWNNLDRNIRNSESVGFFKSKILKFLRPKPNSIYNCYNPKGVILITRLRLGLSHLREHKFKHSFQDSGSGRPKVFCEKGVLRNFLKFTGKHRKRDSGTGVFL